MRRETLRLTSDLTIARTAGEVYMLSKQPVASEQFWLATTGSKKAPADPSFDAGIAPELADRLAYLGTAEQGDDVTIVILTETPTETSDARSGTHTKLMIAARVYDNMKCASWPLGFRVSEDAYPTTSYARVYIFDVAAWYTINALAPIRNRVGTSIDRARFMQELIRLLSVAGTFNRIAQLGEYETANLLLEHYPFLGNNITMSHIVAWLIQHGIARDGDAIRVLESFARSRRNAVMKRNSPSHTDFDDGAKPRNETDMLSMGDADIIHWRDLEHGTLQPGNTSTAPRRPGAPQPMDETSG
ncbi:hypothetical protein B0H11DRAFT_2052742 [Mycena galericulata]|nr:hypothetical protein B0H11DRAFT_2052742 [Mycena galericulata]